eukprot:739400-Hanusia_phi.AAC.1
MEVVKAKTTSSRVIKTLKETADSEKFFSERRKKSKSTKRDKTVTPCFILHFYATSTPSAPKTFLFFGQQRRSREDEGEYKRDCACSGLRQSAMQRREGEVTWSPRWLGCSTWRRKGRRKQRSADHQRENQR